MIERIGLDAAAAETKSGHDRDRRLAMRMTRKQGLSPTRQKGQGRRPGGVFIALVLLLVFFAVPARAGITWLGALSPHELTGADLFHLRGDMPAELQAALRPLRNVTYPSEADFRAGLKAAVPDAAMRAAWEDRLVAIAARPGVCFGTEFLKTGIMTVRLAGKDHVLDTNAFTSKSWLTALPPPAETPSGDVTAVMNGTCLEVLAAGEALFSLCDAATGSDGSSLTLVTEADAVYGLGQQFDRPGDAIANRIGEKRDGLNVMAGFNGGANGNTLIPIAYFDRSGRKFALFLDNRTPQVWDFSTNPWRLSVKGGDFRLHVLTGQTLADLRRRYMALSGTPPVPPKAMFGLWLSEYGFDDWAEIDERIASLDENGFPLSGVVLDLQWFGGIGGKGGPSRMGTLGFDTTAFPDPAERIAALKARGIGVMTIEESYVDRSLPEFDDMAARGYLAHDAAGIPLLTSPAPQWWGWGGMIDWARPEAGAYWHDLKRQPLVDLGVMAHWTDLGEPEMFNPDNLYGTGLTEQQVQNSYNVLWLESIADGYRRDAPSRRAFMMSRSGGAGMQRLGAAMWSGDTGSDFWSLLGQMPQQTHMMWSGIDYYGSDVGGFHRGALRHYDDAPDREAAMDALYTQWLAYSALFEVPVRPHTENLCNCKQTAPDRIGDLASNRANLELRYALLPYYYSLAHMAWHTGDPVFPGLDYWYPGDKAALADGRTKMIGRDLIAMGVAEYGAKTAEITLPVGAWYDFHTGTPLVSKGTPSTVPLWRDGLFALPLFARDGAMVPMDENGTRVLDVFGSGDGAFDWYDDDGETLAYQDGIYDLVQLDKAGLNLTLTRALGTALTPQRLDWHLPDGVEPKAAMIDGQTVAFAKNGNLMSVDLPALAKTMTVELIL